MAFVNEYISPEDRQKYGIDELNKFYHRMFLPMGSGNSWTIDRQKNCYLRFVRQGRYCEEGEERISYFSFYWNGLVRVIRFQSESGGGGRQALVWKQKYYLKKIDPPIDDLDASQRKQFFDVLKEALIAFRDFGVLSKAPQFEASFDF